MRHPVLLILSVVVVAAAYGRLLVEFGANLWDKPYYQHFPFVILGGLVLIARDLMRQTPGERRRSGWLAVVGAVVAWLLLAGAYLVYSPLLAAASFILLVGVALRVATRSAGYAFPTGPWLLFWLVIPPPVGLDRRLVTELQLGSSRLASNALDLIGIDHLMDGNTLQLVSKQLFVDEACSGVVSVISLVACAAMYGVWRDRPVMHTVLLMVTAAGWGGLMNVVRIVSIALAEAWRGLDWTEGLPHTIVALVAFSLSLLALVATDWLFRALLAEVGPRWAELTGEPIRFGRPLVSLWDWFFGGHGANEAEQFSSQPSAFDNPLEAYRAVLAAAPVSIVGLLAFAVLAPAQVVLLTDPDTARLAARRPFPQESALVQRLLDGAMPESLGELTLMDVKHEQRGRLSNFGEHSVIYTYQHTDGDSYRVSCDFPYVDGWHELSVCYEGIGWRLEDYVTVGMQSEQARCAQLSLTRPDGSLAAVTYCAAFADGEPIEPAQQTLLGEILAKFQPTRPPSDRQSFQVQVLAVRSDALTERDKQVSAELLDEGFRRLAPIVTDLVRQGEAPVSNSGNGDQPG